ncbi:MAG: glucokinase [Blastocatellia bacterium]|jgi:predicted NBD/HSP70 family sugar kinase|nr:glucokinase [Blastocatellia bacterium]
MNAKTVDARHDANAVLVVDIGGTHVKVGTTRNRLKPLFIEPTPEDAERTLNLVAELSLAAARETGRANGARQRLVCGSGGLITRAGVCTKALYTPFAGVNIREELVNRLGGDVHVLNDASLQAHGVAKLAPNSIVICIGTGVGGAIISEGRVVVGAHGFAGEIGHALTAYSGTRCECGQLGCLDTVASGFAFEKALGTDWFNRVNESVEMHLERLAEAVADSALACAALLDVDAAILVGWPARYAIIRKGLRLRLSSTYRKVNFFRNGWPLCVMGAQEINATHWRNK